MIDKKEYYEVTKLPYLQERFREERAGYFSEKDAQSMLDQLITPFDEDAIQALKCLFKAEQSEKDFRTKLLQFC